MDVCTLLVVTGMNALACISQPVCEIVGDVQFCTSGGPVPCPVPPNYYECVRPDKSKYTMTEDRKPLK